MEISVIIPVYNAALYVEKAVVSALQHSEVKEVVVVNDGSTDDSLSVLEKLQQLDNRIKIYHHKNKINKGRSASRNLGIRKAIANYIAFLDADDFYLEDRFVNDKKILLENTKADGVYNAIGVHFYRETTVAESEELQMTTVKEHIRPEILFEALLSGKKGYFSIDGLIVKKSVFEKTGYFSEDLTVAEDTELILKMTLKVVLVAGIIDKPLALRGVHEENSFSNDDLYEVYRIKMYNNLLNWCLKEEINNKRIALVIDLLWYYRGYYRKTIREDLIYWSNLFIQYPKLIKSKAFLKKLPLIRWVRLVLKT